MDHRIFLKMSKIILPIYFINLFSQNKLNFSLTYAIIKFCYFYATFYFHFKYLFSLELYSLNLRRKKEKKEIDFSNLSYYNTYYTIFLNYHILIVCGMLYHLSYHCTSKANPRMETKGASLKETVCWRHTSQLQLLSLLYYNYVYYYRCAARTSFQPSVFFLWRANDQVFFYYLYPLLSFIYTYICISPWLRKW